MQVGADMRNVMGKRGILKGSPANVITFTGQGFFFNTFLLFSESGLPIFLIHVKQNKINF